MLALKVEMRVEPIRLPCLLACMSLMIAQGLCQAAADPSCVEQGWEQRLSVSTEVQTFRQITQALQMFLLGGGVMQRRGLCIGLALTR